MPEEFITVGNWVYQLVGRAGAVGVHDEKKCNWRILGGGREWVCDEHHVTVTRHPNGYCSGGCCR